MTVNFIAVIAAAVVAWLFGAAWYMTLGRIWRDALMSRRDKPVVEGKSNVPVVPMIVSFVAELLMAYMLAGLVLHLGAAGVRAGLVTSFFCWLGFVATTLVTNHAYQGERPRVTAIDAGHWLGVLLIEGAIIGAMS